jgi:crotonobetainyl-CoA:carnitine CoA-transferase CaiB-like acyl-CoA transferase
MAAERGGPLADVRVLDLTRMLAGPYCTMLLADLGADVVKVEPPEGDSTRRTPPFPAGDELRAFGGYFASINRNKRSIVLDLKRIEAREVLTRLADSADVLVENFRPGVMERLGLAYESLDERNPKLVYVSVRGFGDPRTGESPYAQWPAYDVTAQAMGGLMGITGTEDGQPIKTGPGVGDVFPATLAAVGVLAALHHAERTGEGQYVDVAMVDGILSLSERIVYQYSYGREVPRPQGNGHPLLAPFDLFPTSDGWVSIAAPADAQWATLVALIGHPELAADERFAVGLTRVRHAREVREVVGGWTGSHTTREVLAVLGGHVPVAPVNSVEDLFDDPHPRAREMLVEIDHPGTNERMTIAGAPIKLTSTPSGVRRRAPLLGEHTDEVLAELGYDTEDIAALRAVEAVR